MKLPGDPEDGRILDIVGAVDGTTVNEFQILLVPFALYKDIP